LALIAGRGTMEEMAAAPCQQSTELSTAIVGAEAGARLPGRAGVHVNPKIGSGFPRSAFNLPEGADSRHEAPVQACLINESWVLASSSVRQRSGSPWMNATVRCPRCAPLLAPCCDRLR